MALEFVTDLIYIGIVESREIDFKINALIFPLQIGNGRSAQAVIEVEREPFSKGRVFRSGCHPQRIVPGIIVIMSPVSCILREYPCPWSVFLHNEKQSIRSSLDFLFIH